MHLEDYDRLTLEENHRLGIGHFDARRFFPAHEAWETCWKQAKGTEDAEFFKGLSQLGAGYVHFQRGNAHGTQALLRRGAGRLAAYGEQHLSIPARNLARLALEHAHEVEEAATAGDEMPAIAFPSTVME